MRGPEERDGIFARLFGLTAIIQSDALFGPVAAAASFETVVQDLLVLGQAKGWLRESTWWALIAAVERLLASEVEWKEAAVRGLLEAVFGDKGWSQEKVALALVLERRRPVSNARRSHNGKLTRIGSRLEDIARSHL